MIERLLKAGIMGGIRPDYHQVVTVMVSVHCWLLESVHTALTVDDVPVVDGTWKVAGEFPVTFGIVNWDPVWVWFAVAFDVDVDVCGVVAPAVDVNDTHVPPDGSDNVTYPLAVEAKVTDPDCPAGSVYATVLLAGGVVAGVAGGGTAGPTGIAAEATVAA
jgi:hypothetical protein